MAERAVVMELVIPSQDENGKPLRLTKFQEHSIGDILRTLEHGAVVGVGTARGALLGDTMGAGKTIEAIVVVNTVPTFRRILVLCMVPGGGVGPAHSPLADPRPTHHPGS
jgi:hypothetical protein